MKIPIFKMLFVVIVLAVTFLGIRFSYGKIKIVNEQVSVTTVSLGQQAQAYCNEAQYPGETNSGHCTGKFNDTTSRCITATQSQDCSS